MSKSARIPGIFIFITPNIFRGPYPRNRRGRVLDFREVRHCQRPKPHVSDQIWRVNLSKALFHADFESEVEIKIGQQLLS